MTLSPSPCNGRACAESRGVEWSGGEWDEDLAGSDTFRNLRHPRTLHMHYLHLHLDSDRDLRKLYTPQAIFPASLEGVRIHDVPHANLDRIVSNILEQTQAIAGEGPSTTSSVGQSRASTPMKQIELDVLMEEGVDQLSDTLYGLSDTTVDNLRRTADELLKLDTFMQLNRMPRAREEGYKLLVEAHYTVPKAQPLLLIQELEAGSEEPSHLNAESDAYESVNGDLRTLEDADIGESPDESLDENEDMEADI